MTFGTVVTDLPESLRQALDEQVKAAFECYRSEAGYRLANHVRLVTGRVHLRYTQRTCTGLNHTGI